MAKTTETVLEIDLNALAHNYHYLKARIKESTLFLAVVKAYGYGSDASEIAKKLEHLKVDYFAVAYVSEGVSLKKAGITTPILVLHPQATNFKTLIENNLEPNLYAPKILKAFLLEAKKQNVKDYPIHIKFNTGLNRLGFSENDIDFLLEEIANNDSVKIKSVFSHLAASEDRNEKEFTIAQIEAFKKICEKFYKKLGYSPIKHILNTSGVLNYPEAQYNMVRCGIGLYGFSNDPEIDVQLQPISTLKTTISQLHTISANESVGYNRAFKAEHTRTTATLPIGHADGIRRQYGKGKAHVIVNGEKASVIGNVCMDMIIVDVTGIDCKEGDQVLFFGTNTSAEEFASSGNTISYELLTGISQRVKRVYINA